MGSSFKIQERVIKRGVFGIQLSRGEGLRSSYQEGRVWDPVIKRGGFRIQLSRGEGLRSSYQEGRVINQGRV